MKQVFLFLSQHLTFRISQQQNFRRVLGQGSTQIEVRALC